jgi:uncharacterized SAM-binding protein YcdF (DUF218 family)
MNQPRVIKNIDRVMGAIGTLAAVLFLATALTPVSNYAGSYFAINPDIRPAGAIVVLGAGLWKGGMLDNESLRRTLRGIELYKNSLAPVIVFSGPARDDEPGRSEAEVRTQLAINMGIPAGAIVKEDVVNTTREESVRIAKTLQGRGIQSILLVTESLHMRRATYLFARTGMTVYPVPSDNFTLAAASPEERIQLATRLAEETAALIYYRIAGYI